MRTSYLIIIALLVAVQLNAQSMKKQYQREVEQLLQRADSGNGPVVTEADLAHLPEPVQQYLHYVGVVGKPLPAYFTVKGRARMRSNPEDPWMAMVSEQYNLLKEPVRAFYLKAKKMGLPAVGLHLYKEGKAFMVVKLLNLFKVVDARGPEMNQSETVTFFNDMCVMAPATLIDRSIQWEVLDDRQVKAYFTRKGITISAELFFDEEGRLVNFRSYDRYEIIGKACNNYPWETPILEYGEFNGYRLPTRANLDYLRPEGRFTYGEFEITGVVYK